MLAKELVSDVVPCLMTSDSGAQALSWMDHFRVSHLPVVNNRDFLGLISDQDISTINDPTEPIGNHQLTLFSPFVYLDQHVIEVVQLVAQLKLSLIPVLNRQKEYVGSITLPDLTGYITQLTGFDQPGAIIILTMTVHDYSLNLLSRIVEENGAKIISQFVNSSPETMELDVTMKVNTTDIASILRSLERFDFNVKASFLEDDDQEQMYRNRYEEFMRYLNT